MTTYQARTLSVSIDRPWREVYAFASVPENFARWASGLGSDLVRSGDVWTAKGAEGPIRIRFSAPNDFGVLDHTVLAGPDTAIHNPMRVVANGTGSEVLFTLFRQPDMSAERFAADADWVERDLRSLKALLEA